MDAAKLIAEIVQKQGISEYRLAKELGVNPSAVSHWKRGKAHPNGAHLMELLRRAGRLAAMVLIVTGVSGMVTPGDSHAQVRNTHYAKFVSLWREAIRRLLLNSGDALGPSATLAVR